MDDILINGWGCYMLQIERMACRTRRAWPEQVSVLWANGLQSAKEDGLSRYIYKREAGY